MTLSRLIPAIEEGFKPRCVRTDLKIGDTIILFRPRPFDAPYEDPLQFYDYRMVTLETTEEIRRFERTLIEESLPKRSA